MPDRQAQAAGPARRGPLLPDVAAVVGVVVSLPATLVVMASAGAAVWERLSERDLEGNFYECGWNQPDTVVAVLGVATAAAIAAAVAFALGRSMRTTLVAAVVAGGLIAALGLASVYERFHAIDMAC